MPNPYWVTYMDWHLRTIELLISALSYLMEARKYPHPTGELMRLGASYPKMRNNTSPY